MDRNISIDYYDLISIVDPISGFRTTRSNSGNSSLAASEMNTTKGKFSRNNLNFLD